MLYGDDVSKTHGTISVKRESQTGYLVLFHGMSLMKQLSFTALAFALTHRMTSALTHRMTSLSRMTEMNTSFSVASL